MVPKRKKSLRKEATKMSKFGDLLRAAEGKAAPTPKKVEAPAPAPKPQAKASVFAPKPSTKG